ncbi:hypothetical protein Hanom_Chr03g00260761 [Helianthus anomalus]
MHVKRIGQRYYNTYLLSFILSPFILEYTQTIFITHGRTLIIIAFLVCFTRYLLITIIILRLNLIGH